MIKPLDSKIADYIDKNKTTKSFGSIINNLSNNNSIFKKDKSHLKLNKLDDIVKELKNSHITSEEKSNNDSLPSKTHKTNSIKSHSN